MSRDAPVDVRVSVLSRAAGIMDHLESLFRCHFFAFENGDGSVGEARINCVNHVHVHVAPIPHHMSLDGLLAGAGFSSLRNDPSTALERISPSLDYVLAWETEDSCRLKVGPEIESQLLRKLLTRELGGHKHWNWRDDPGLSDIRAAIDCLSSENLYD